jgi:hypothetical protein
MPKVIKETRETRADPKRLPTVDITGRQRLAAPRRQRDAARRGQALVDGQGMVNDMVLLCRSGTRQQQIDRAAMRKQGRGGERPTLTLRGRWGAFLLQTGRGHLTIAQARSVRRRSTLDEIYSLTFDERIMLGVRGPE